MNIIEAARSGKRVKPVNADFGGYEYIEDYPDRVIVRHLTDNWEVEERKVEVTESQIREVMEKAHKTVTTPCEIDYVCQLLGLRD